MQQNRGTCGYRDIGKHMARLVGRQREKSTGEGGAMKSDGRWVFDFVAPIYFWMYRFRCFTPALYLPPCLCANVFRGMLILAGVSCHVSVGPCLAGFPSFTRP